MLKGGHDGRPFYRNRMCGLSAQQTCPNWKGRLFGYQTEVRSWIAITIASVTGSGVASSQVVVLV